MTHDLRLLLLLPLLLLTPSLHAQNLLGKQLKDAVIQLGNEYTSWQEGPITKIRYAPTMVDHPEFGRFREYDHYDFVNGVCEARHSFIPRSLEKDFIAYLHEQFGKGDHLWRGDNHTYIAIKEHDDNFELMTWTPEYEAVLDNR